MLCVFDFVQVHFETGHRVPTNTSPCGALKSPTALFFLGSLGKIAARWRRPPVSISAPRATAFVWLAKLINNVHYGSRMLELV